MPGPEVVVWERAQHNRGAYASGNSFSLVIRYSSSNVKEDTTGGVGRVGVGCLSLVWEAPVAVRQPRLPTHSASPMQRN